MSSIRTDHIAFDTNEFIYALRETPGSEAIVELLVDKIEDRHIYLPLPVMSELNRNLSQSELRRLFRLLHRAKDLWEDRLPPSTDIVSLYRERGAKKGDAGICACLHVAQI